MMTPTTIAFIGLGAMGSHSARHLVRAGFKVRAYDIRPEALGAFEQDGGLPCNSAAEAMDGASHAILFVVNGKQAEDVIFGPEGLHASARPGTTIISCVTMLPDEAVALGTRCAEKSWRFIDSPVSGGEVGAQQGSLTIMAAGEPSAIEASEALFAHIGTRLKRIGDRPGQGALVKTINQMLCGIHLAAAGEAMAMARRAGLDLQTVFDVVSQSAAGSWMLSDRGPRMVAESFDTPTSAVDIFVKDLGIVLDVARSLRFPVPVSASALQSFLGASGSGMAKKDDAAVIRYYEGFHPLAADAKNPP